MTDIFDITRREFIRNSALLSAGTALGARCGSCRKLHWSRSGSARLCARARVSLRRCLFPQNQPAGSRTGRVTTRPRPRIGMNIFPPLVHVVGHRSRSRKIRLVRLRPHDGPCRKKRNQSGSRRTGWLCSRMGVSASILTPATSEATGSSSTAPYRRAAQLAAFLDCASTIRTCRPLPRPSWWRWSSIIRDHPALFGYDLWNEGTSFGGNPHRMYCYCEGTQAKTARVAQAPLRIPR